MRKQIRIVRRERQVRYWNAIFSTHRPLKDLPFFQTREYIPGFERDFVAAFLQDSESSIPSWKCAVLEKFFKSGSDKFIQNPARARLDDREYKSKTRRQYPGYPEWLTPELLRDAIISSVNSNWIHSCSS